MTKIKRALGFVGVAIALAGCGAYGSGGKGGRGGNRGNAG